MTIFDFYTQYISKFNTEQKRDFVWLIEARTNTQYLDWKQTQIPQKVVAQLNFDMENLLLGKPLAYILGETEFLGCKIKVNHNVLIPRPETEQLCDMISKDLAGKTAKVLDLCTGSGCIAIALKQHNSNLQVIASDKSEQALLIAEQNAKLNNVEIEFILSDMFAQLNNSFDVIVSNPPYLNLSNKEDYPKSLDFEPQLALWGGEDGLDFYRIIASKSIQFLNKNGIIYLEIGHDQAQSVKELFSVNFDVEVLNDYFGVKRFIIARRK
ncbi:MAG: peptide chain release factor N(5)-glutamine methyltransferase [Clostridia bacterium]|nr:peptide chain release factor N(5)-glutamine methyltransferase [Clostridia bacterium]